ncbi:MAG: imelysin family protein [Polyangiales bacterium]
MMKAGGYVRGIALSGVALASVLALRCSNGNGNGGGEAGPEFDRNALLASVGENVILPTYAEFEEAATTLDERASAWSDAVEAGEDIDAARMDAQQAWREAMDVWQRAELLQVGPAGPAGEAVGGESLRDEIYSWPESVNPCRVDQELVANAFEEDGFFDGALVNVYGLDALEYLLFYSEAENSCAPQVSINADGSWEALDAMQLQQRRATYAAAVAERLLEDAQRLHDAWDPDEGDFLGDFAQAGEDGSAYESARRAVDDLFAAMFYLDTVTKDQKLAEPTGIAESCSQAPCLDAVESPWAEHSKENVANNLRGFLHIMRGEMPDEGEGPGFDAALGMVDAQDLADTMLDDTEAAIDSLDAVEGRFTEALQDDLESVRDVHAAVKAITDNLKMELVMRLGLQVPMSGGGDTD